MSGAASDVADCLFDLGICYAVYFECVDNICFTVYLSNSFDIDGFLDTAGVARTVTAAGSILFADMSLTWIGSLLLL